MFLSEIFFLVWGVINQVEEQTISDSMQHVCEVFSLKLSVQIDKERIRNVGNANRRSHID